MRPKPPVMAHSSTLSKIFRSESHPQFCSSATLIFSYFSIFVSFFSFDFLTIPPKNGKIALKVYNPYKGLILKYLVKINHRAIYSVYWMPMVEKHRDRKVSYGDSRMHRTFWLCSETAYFVRQVQRTSIKLS